MARGIPEDVRQKLSDANVWHLVTLNDDGAPTSTPVWAHVEGDRVLVNTALGRRKERNVHREPRVALSMTEKDNPYSWVEIRGRVVEIVEGKAAHDSADELAAKYDVFPERAPGEQRVLLRIEPTAVVSSS